MIEGFLSVASVFVNGRPITTQEAIDRGMFIPVRRPSGWGLAKHEIPLGRNLFVNSGRQSLAYAFGFRSPIVNYVCTEFGIGTGTTPPQASNTGLETPLKFYSTPGNSNPSVPDSFFKPITSTTWTEPFVSATTITVAADEANGYTITELGLFSGTDGTGGQMLLARKTIPGYVKTSASSFSFVWRIRF